MNIPILFEDADLLVIDKPVGVVVNRAQSIKVPTLQDWMEQKFKIQNLEFKIDEKDFYDRSGVVHRLDKETSGCMVLAKNAETFIKLQTLFKERQVLKSYVALTHGKVIPKQGKVVAPIGRLPWNREQFGVVPGGKEAETKYVVERHYVDAEKNYYSLVSLTPKTGRTHQIRVHLKYIGFPIVGDYLYAGRKQQKKDRLWCGRVFLHANSISFKHPKTGLDISVVCNLPSDLEQVLSQLVVVATAY